MGNPHLSLAAQSYTTDYFHNPRCATYGSFNDNCRSPPGPDGPPGCEDSANSTDSCSKVLPQPQVTAKPPHAPQGASYSQDCFHLQQLTLLANGFICSASLSRTAQLLFRALLGGHHGHTAPQQRHNRCIIRSTGPSR